MKEQSDSLKKIIADEEQHKKERKAAGNLFTGYDKVSPKQKRALLEKLAVHIDNWDDKLVYEDLLRTVEKSKLGITLNYQYVDENLIKSDAVFVENKDLGLKVKDDQPNNLIIEGDNLHTLTALKNTNQEVDVIYIDPPYNTGKEFEYNDKLVSEDDQQKHSKWLSFMTQRLELAKEVLSEDGIMFLSIDDNEQAYIKILMDEIFGESNFLTTIIYDKTRQGPNDGNALKKQHEYVLVFGKTKKSLDAFVSYEFREREQKYKYKDEKGWFALTNTFNSTHPANKNKNLVYTIYWNPKTKDIKTIQEYDETTDTFQEPNKKYVDSGYIFFRPRIHNGYRTCWTWSEKKLKRDFDDMTFKKVDSGWIPYYKNRYTGKTQLSTINTFDPRKTGSSTLQKIFNEKMFSYPKPVELIKWLVQRHTNKNATVLDFFAGSGTTAQAVMELNQEDGGNRRFILCTNNERTGFDTIKHPEKGIAQAICRERIHRVINGVGSKGEPIKWTYSDDLKSLKNNSVRYLKTELVNKRRIEKDKPHLTHNLFFTREQRDLYKKEFNSDSTEAVTDFKKRKRGISR